jgi:hypothetical protein
MKLYISRLDINDLNPDSKFIQVEVSFYDEETTPQCMSSKGFGQIRDKNKRGFQVPKYLLPVY